MSRVLLKISGEALKDTDSLVSINKLNIVLKTIQLLQKYHHQIGIVIGGGNFFRGREHPEMDKVTADTIGMIGTVMNSLYLKDYLMKNNIKAVVSTPFNFPSLIPSYSDTELKELYFDNIIIFGGGIGKSGYSTDSGVVMAATVLDSDLIIKLTNVDGVYDSDPKINKSAKKYDKITYQEVLDKELNVMDLFAIQKCQEKNIKILVMSFEEYQNIEKFFDGKQVGTLIGE